MRSLRASDGIVIAYAVAAGVLVAIARERIDFPGTIAAAHLAIALAVVALAELQDRNGGGGLTAARSWDALLVLPIFVALARVLLPQIHAQGMEGELARIDGWIGAADVKALAPPWIASAMLGLGIAAAALPLLPALELYAKDRPGFWHAKTVIVLAVVLSLLVALSVPTAEGAGAFPNWPAAAAMAAIAMSMKRGLRTKWVVLPVGLAAVAAMALAPGTYVVSILGAAVVTFAACLLAGLWNAPPSIDPKPAPAPVEAEVAASAVAPPPEPAPAPAPEPVAAEAHVVVAPVPELPPYEPPVVKVVSRTAPPSAPKVGGLTWQDPFEFVEETVAPPEPEPVMVGADDPPAGPHRKSTTRRFKKLEPEPEPAPPPPAEPDPIPVFEIPKPILDRVPALERDTTMIFKRRREPRAGLV